MGDCLYLKDNEGTVYEFLKSGIIRINEKKGKGSLVTPVSEIGVHKSALFSFNGKNYKTGLVVGIMVK